MSEVLPPDEDWLDAGETAALTAPLFGFRSYPGEEGEVQRAVAVWLHDNGLEPCSQPNEGDRPKSSLRSRTEMPPAAQRSR